METFKQFLKRQMAIQRAKRGVLAIHHIINSTSIDNTLTDQLCDLKRMYKRYVTNLKLKKMDGFKIIPTKIFSLPVYWASALVNNDCSGLSANDENIMNEWYLKNASGWACVDVSESTDFKQFNGLGCEVAEFTFINRFE